MTFILYCVFEMKMERL